MAKIKQLTRPKGQLSAKATEQIARLLQAGLVEIRSLLQAGKHKQAEQLASALHNVPEVLLDLDYYDIAEDVRQSLITYQLDYFKDRTHPTDFVGQLESALAK